MSVQAMSAVFEHSEARGSARVVMFVLADHADEYGFARPGVERVAKMARIDGRNVQRHLKTLVSLGELDIIYRLRQASVYRLRLPGLRAIDREEQEKLAEWGVTRLRVAELSPEPKAFTKGLISKPSLTTSTYGSGDEIAGGGENVTLGNCGFCGEPVESAGYCTAGCEAS